MHKEGKGKEEEEEEGKRGPLTLSADGLELIGVQDTAPRLRGLRGTPPKRTDRRASEGHAQEGARDRGDNA